MGHQLIGPSDARRPEPQPQPHPDARPRGTIPEPRGSQPAARSNSRSRSRRDRVWKDGTVIDPTAVYARPFFAAVLVLVVALLLLRAIRRDRREYQRFKSFTRTDQRQRMYRKCLLQSAAVFGGSSLVLLALLGPQLTFILDDVHAVPWVRQLRLSVSDTGGLAMGVVIGGIIAVLALTVLGVFAARRDVTVRSVGDIGALLPRNRAELAYGAALSINAGIVEELLFRLALPTLVFAVTGNSVVAIVVAIALFGSLHLYQGVAGVVGSTVIGTVLMAVFLATGSIVTAIALHALIDLRSLVLIPLVVNRVWSADDDGPRTEAQGPS